MILNVIRQKALVEQGKAIGVVGGELGEGWAERGVGWEEGSFFLSLSLMDLCVNGHRHRDTHKSKCQASFSPSSFSRLFFLQLINLPCPLQGRISFSLWH